MLNYFTQTINVVFHCVVRKAYVIFSHNLRNFLVPKLQIRHRSQSLE